MSLLCGCAHPHLLPLLGYSLEKDACLVFPLMRGGSLADRLWPGEANSQHLGRLGLRLPLAPLSWRELLRILRQTIGALLYLHTADPTSGKGVVLHRDFKPENILLDEQLRCASAWVASGLVGEKVE